MHAFGDVSDITSVILYGPADSLLYSQLSGRGARSHELRRVCQLLYSTVEVKEADKHMQLACTEEVCLGQLLLNSVLESTELVESISDQCCSVCAGGVVPLVYSCGDLTRQTDRPASRYELWRMTPEQKKEIRKELVALQHSIAQTRFRLRGLDAIIPLQR